jgi:hypothetical protein
MEGGIGALRLRVNPCGHGSLAHAWFTQNQDRAIAFGDAENRLLNQRSYRNGRGNWPGLNFDQSIVCHKKFQVQLFNSNASSKPCRCAGSTDISHNLRLFRRFPKCEG